ncbi:MAG: 30S ribosomal protein S6 [Balneolaceae bacterium]|nr:MAG: 30S ribosomal protein S6 [Balneolaceae bacterium]
MKKYFYEMTYILNPVLEEEQYSEMVDFVNKLIEKNGGEIVEVEEWGVKKLAYDVKGKGNGYYVNLYFNAPAEAIVVVERNLRIHDNVMRYLTLKYDAKMLRHYDLKKKGELPAIFEVDIAETADED